MKTRTIGALAATLLIGTAFISPAAAVQTAAPTTAPVAASSSNGVVIAQDQTTQLDAVPTAPRAVTVTTAPRASVTLAARGMPTKTQTANKRGITTFTGLKAGTRYTVTSGDRTTTVTPVVKVGKANDLTVTTTDQLGTVNLTWKHKKNRARGGATIGYTVTATPVGDATAPVTMETNASDVELNGLNPQTLYTFTVTPHNALGNGQSSIARMTRSLADITGAKVPLDNPDASAPRPNPESDNQSETQTETTPAQNNQPAPRPAPRPNTRTIWVCPDGFSDVGGVCTQSRGYTFHSAQETQPYTYRSETRTESCAGPDCPGSRYIDFGTDWTGGGCPNGGTLHDGKCMGWTSSTRQVTVQVKNDPPSGWSDNGTEYVRTVQVKDPTPSGWSDNGSEWIRTTAKVEKVVPA